MISFSSELRWLATCPEPWSEASSNASNAKDWDRETIYQNTIKAFTALAAEAWDLSVMPVFAGLCPHNDFKREQAELLRRADTELKRQGVAVLDWLYGLSPGGDKFGTLFLCHFKSL